eukprot:TRINITY_DN2239_c0_g1_i1.p1 TRINITY_DN2239_c0_g1~~TRINITY_DN2239_c0_g1_i1.p1  ORF type:complete len:232 (-),score=57.57 TRINITY_DN2239_c0_g1_i1:68-763(-)
MQGGYNPYPPQYPPQQYPPTQYPNTGLQPPPQQYPPQQYPPMQQHYPPMQQHYPPQQYPPMQQHYPPMQQHYPQQPMMNQPLIGAMYEFHFAGHKLDRKDITSKSDPFLILSRPRDMQSIPSSYKTQTGSSMNVYSDWIVVHKTEYVLNNQSPVWKPFRLNLGELCFNNLDCPFLIECYDWDDNGKHDFIGSVKASIRELQVMKEMQLRNPKRLGIGDVAGLLKVVKCIQC